MTFDLQSQMYDFNFWLDVSILQLFHNKLFKVTTESHANFKDNIYIHVYMPMEMTALQCTVQLTVNANVW